MEMLPVNSLPVGFGFRPTDEELFNHYLRLKNEGEEREVEWIREVDLNNLEPWDLPGLSIIKSDDQEWFFFSTRLQKYPSGRRFDRATNAGYWKATGQDRSIRSCSSGMKLMGKKKTLVFYKGRAPKGEKTAWIIHEYSTNSEKCAFVLCRLFNRDVKFKYSNGVQVNLTVCSPTVMRSPEFMPSKQLVVQSTPKSGMHAKERPAIFERCSNHKSDSNALVPKENHNNAYVVSDVEHHEAEVRAAEVEPLLDDCLSLLYEPTDEEVVFPNCDGRELTGSTPTAAGSSPEGMQSNQPVAQSTSESDMQVGEEVDKTGNISPDALVPEEGHFKTYMASGVEDRKTEVGTTEVQQMEKLLSYLYEPTDCEGDYSNCDEIELTGFNPITAGSAPEHMPSNMPSIQSTCESYMQVGEQPLSIERYLADKSDNITSNALVHEEGHHNTCMASDMENHVLEISDTEMDLLLSRFFKEPTVEPLNSKIFSPNHTINLPIIQSISESYMQDGEQPSSIERYLADKSENITSNALVHEEGHHNTCMASDMEAHEPETSDTEMDLLLSSFFKEPTVEPLNSKIFSPNHTINLPIIQSISESYMQDGEQPSSIERYLTDKSENITSNALVHEEGHHNTCMDSDMEAHVPEVDLLWSSFFKAPTVEPLDSTIPFHSEMLTGPGSYSTDSSFACNVYNAQNWMYDQEGSSVTKESWQMMVHNDQEYSSERSTSQKNSTIESKPSHAPIHFQFQSGTSMCGRNSISGSDTDIKVAQGAQSMLGRDSVSNRDTDIIYHAHVQESSFVSDESWQMMVHKNQYFCEGSTSQKNSTVESKPAGAHIHLQTHSGQSMFCRNSVSDSNTEIEVAESAQSLLGRDSILDSGTDTVIIPIIERSKGGHYLKSHVNHIAEAQGAQSLFGRDSVLDHVTFPRLSKLIGESQAVGNAECLEEISLDKMMRLRKRSRWNAKDNEAKSTVIEGTGEAMEHIKTSEAHGLDCLDFDKDILQANGEAIEYIKTNEAHGLYFLEFDKEISQQPNKKVSLRWRSRGDGLMGNNIRGTFLLPVHLSNFSYRVMVLVILVPVLLMLFIYGDG